ncbi:MAG: hypothetical protein ACRDN6_13080 [Gaiellaceae bacterium]
MPQDDNVDAPLLVVGHVATMDFLVSFPDLEEADYQPRGDVRGSNVDLDRLLRKKSVHADLESRVNAEVKGALGPEFEVESVIVKGGSLELIAAIMTVSSVVVNYNTLIEGIERAVNNTRRIISGFLRVTLGARGGREVLQMEMTADWVRGTGLVRAETRAAMQQRASAAALATAPVAAAPAATLVGGDAQRVLLAYFLLSHTALIGILIALLVREW